MLKDYGEGNIDLSGGSDIDTLKISLKIKAIFFVIVQNSRFCFWVHPSVN